MASNDETYSDKRTKRVPVRGSILQDIMAKMPVVHQQFRKVANGLFVFERLETPVMTGQEWKRKARETEHLLRPLINGNNKRPSIAVDDSDPRERYWETLDGRSAYYGADINGTLMKPELQVSGQLSQIFHRFVCDLLDRSTNFSGLFTHKVLRFHKGKLPEWKFRSTRNFAHK